MFNDSIDDIGEDSYAACFCSLLELISEVVEFNAVNVSYNISVLLYCLFTL